jgi:hypothetical protein
MGRYLALLVASTAAAGLIAACSAAPESGQLGGGGYGTPSSSTGTGSGTDNTGNGATNPGNTGTPSTGTTGTPTPVDQPPPPAAGPGSTGSAAHAYFVSTVLPALSVCSACHVSGVDGAPKMLDANADIAYQNLDARGLIVSNSMLLSKGVHDATKAPALIASQQQVLTQWLSLEAGERQGKAAPVNVLAAVAQCMDQTKFEAIGLQNLRTIRRTNENANNCTGCDNAPCKTCHGDTATGFYMTLGSNIDKATFAMSQKQPYITKYFGLNGVEPVASNGIQTKADAVAKGLPYSHPMFTLTGTTKTNLDAFVADTIAKYKAGTCGGDAGAPPDAGP